MKRKYRYNWHKKQWDELYTLDVRPSFTQIKTEVIDEGTAYYSRSVRIPALPTDNDEWKLMYVYSKQR